MRNLELLTSTFKSQRNCLIIIRKTIPRIICKEHYYVMVTIY